MFKFPTDTSKLAGANSLNVFVGLLGINVTVSVYGNFSSFTTQHLKLTLTSSGSGSNNFTYNVSSITTLLTYATVLFLLKFNKYCVN